MIDRRSLIKALGAGATVSIAGGAVVGCTNRPVGAERDPDVIRLWGIWASEAQVEQDVITAFSKTHPDITIQVSQVPSNGQGDASSAITAVRGRTGPDLYFMDRFNAPQFASLGLLEPIDRLIEEHEGVAPAKFMSQWIKFSSDELFYDGHDYGLPLYCDTRGLFFNRGLAREAGVDLELLDPANGPMTFDQLWEISDQVNVQDARGTYERVAWIPWDEQASLLMWAMAFGVDFFADSSCSMTLDSPQMLEVARTYRSWVERLDYARLDAFKATYQPPNAPPTQTSFFSDRQLFQISGPWSVKSIQEYKPDMDWGVTHLPVAQAGDLPFNWAGGQSLTMPTGSSMSEAAWEFMRFYAGPEGQKILCPGISFLPTHREAVADPGSTAPGLEFFTDQMAVTRSRPPLPVGTKLWDAMFTMQGQLEHNSQSPEDAVTEAQNYVDPTMQQFCPFRLPEGFGETDPEFHLDTPWLDRA